LGQLKKQEKSVKKSNILLILLIFFNRSFYKGLRQWQLRLCKKEA
jgi:hypothetical protein